MNRIKIPKLIELKPVYKRNGKGMYSTCDVLDFYIEDDSLIYPLNNMGDVKSMKCIKNYNNKYKIFSYKTSGVLSHSVYFLLDIEKQSLNIYCGGQYALSSEVKEWAEYLLNGGSLEKAMEHNKTLDNEFNPTMGI